jgi:flagellar hook assembly protein FlgD
VVVAPVIIRQNVVRPNDQQPVCISARLEKSQHVLVRIYTKRGQLVKTLYDDLAQAGNFEVAWKGVNRQGSVVSSGVYFVYIKTDCFEEKRKVVVVR